MYFYLKKSVLKLFCMQINFFQLISIIMTTNLASFALGVLWHSGGNPWGLSFANSPRLKIATIAKEAVIFDAIYDRPGVSKERLDTEVIQPTLAYLKDLQGKGYVVIDTTTDAQGRMSVSALPEDAIDLTLELKKIVQISTQ